MISEVVFITQNSQVCRSVPESILQPRVSYDLRECMIQKKKKKKEKCPKKITVKIPKGKLNKRKKKIKNNSISGWELSFWYIMIS